MNEFQRYHYSNALWSLAVIWIMVLMVLLVDDKNSIGYLYWWYVCD
ncbi:hypothetical protein ACFL96_19610 [Thermoproteota archaeon]